MRDNDDQVTVKPLKDKYSQHHNKIKFFAIKSGRPYFDHLKSGMLTDIVVWLCKFEKTSITIDLGIRLQNVVLNSKLTNGAPELKEIVTGDKMQRVRLEYLSNRSKTHEIMIFVNTQGDPEATYSIITKRDKTFVIRGAQA